MHKLFKSILTIVILMIAILAIWQTKVGQAKAYYSEDNRYYQEGQSSRYYNYYRGNTSNNPYYSNSVAGAYSRYNPYYGYNYPNYVAGARSVYDPSYRSHYPYYGSYYPNYTAGASSYYPNYYSDYWRNKCYPDRSSESVSIRNFNFTPHTLYVAPNSTVTWRNNDNRPHTVTSRSGSFDSGILRPGQSYSLNFSVPGTYYYYCRLHPDMTGVILVTRDRNSVLGSSSYYDDDYYNNNRYYNNYGSYYGYDGYYNRSSYVAGAYSYYDSAATTQYYDNGYGYPNYDNYNYNQNYVLGSQSYYDYDDYVGNTGYDYSTSANVTNATDSVFTYTTGDGNLHVVTTN